MTCDSSAPISALPASSAAVPRPRARPLIRSRGIVDDHPLVVRVRQFVEHAEAAPCLPVEAPAGTALTHAYFVLDASGSMLRDKDATIAGFNQQVDALQELCAQAASVSASLFVFSNEVGMAFVHAPVEKLQRMTEQNYRPAGGTALMDALGAAIEQAIQAPGAQQADCAFLFQTFTDGAENASQVCDAAVIARCVEMLEATRRFTFALVGPHEHLQSMASMLRLAKGNVRGFDPTSRIDKTAAFDSMGEATKKYLRSRSAGHTASADLYVDAQEPAGDASAG